MRIDTHRRSLRWSLLAPIALVALTAPAAGAPAGGKRLTGAEVVRSANAYAAKRGFRPGRIGRTVTGVSRSRQSTRAKLRIGGREVEVAIHNERGTLQPDSASALLAALAGAHTPRVRAERIAGSRYAVEVVSFQPGTGAGFNAGAWRPGRPGAPLGRPRAGQSDGSVALDAVALGREGSIELRLGTPLTKGIKGAGVRVRENGIGLGRTILNQTPGLVEVSDGSRWYRLGYAGYLRAGDVLTLDRAIDRIPAGAVIDRVRITDAPKAPRTRGPDPTDGAEAAAAGKLGFDLVSVESVVAGAASL